MKEIFVFLTTGFEEIEALATVDILRRANLIVKTVSLTREKQVEGGHNVPVIADLMFDEVNFSNAKMLVLPGGTQEIDNHEGLKKEVLAFAKKGEYVAAICAAPMVLGGLGLLEGKRATCYPGMEGFLKGAILVPNEAVVVDGKLITGRGPSLTFEFALQLVEILAGKATRDQVASDLLMN